VTLIRMEKMHLRAIILIDFAGMLITFGSGCGGGAISAPSSSSQFVKSPVPTPTVLRTLYRVANGTDRMTTIGPNERSTYPLEAQTYYVPDQLGNGSVTLNRVVNASELFGKYNRAESATQVS
jgi:hypothetical protein